MAEVEFITIKKTTELPQGVWLSQASGCRNHKEAIQAFKEMRGMEPKTIYEFKQSTGTLYYADVR